MNTTWQSHGYHNGSISTELKPANKPFIQAKLSVNEPGDAYEQEADKVADQVVQGKSAGISTVSPVITPLQRKCEHCEQEEKKEDKILQKKETAAAKTNASPQVESYVGSLGSGGQSLSKEVRSYYEPRFGYDFSKVRVHTDGVAAKSAQSVNARAYTSGNNIVFNSNQYNFSNDTGKHLLAHELTHVVQQQGSNNLQRKKLTAEDKLEDLQSDRLKNDMRLQQAFDNSPLMQWGETSEGVKTLQRALKDLGYELPISFKSGDADGIFGKETHDVLKKFQSDNKLDDIDGIAGRDTLKALDQKFLNTPPAGAACNINYVGGKLDQKGKDDFLKKNFSDADRPGASKILDDLCEANSTPMNFSTESELHDEILKRLRVSQYMKESQTDNAFNYPENAAAAKCPGTIGNALLDARVNAAAKTKWNGPILESRSFIKNSHYYFELTAEGKQDAYNAIKLLFTPQDNICNRTLIHCDSLIALVQTLASADTMGKDVFNDRVKNGTLAVYLTYDGMSAIEGDKTPTASGENFVYVRPGSESDLIIGDHVVFWNHLGYDAISVKRPGPWRLENALLVDKDAAGNDLYEGHGAPAINNVVQPGPKDAVLSDLMGVYNSYASDALAITGRVDNGEAAATAELADKFPQVKKQNDNKWYVMELQDDNHKSRLKDRYELKLISGTNDPDLTGLKDPQDPSKMNSVKRPKESL